METVFWGLVLILLILLILNSVADLGLKELTRKKINMERECRIKQLQERIAKLEEEKRAEWGAVS